MLYTIAAYHDIGYHINSKNHEIISAKIMYEDENLKSFFDEKQLKIMKEAIEDHRASLDREPRSIYGKLVSSTDRNINVDESLRRIYFYSIEHFNKLNKEETIEECYKHTLKKFGEDGYANFFLEEKDYENYLKELQYLLNNKNEFIAIRDKVRDLRRCDMKGKTLKSFIIIEIVISIIFCLIINGITYLSRDIIWWKSLIAILITWLIYIFCGALNIVFHIKNMKLKFLEPNV